MPENPRDRMARHFGLGEYGKKLADEILDDYLRSIVEKLRETGLGLAAAYLEESTMFIVGDRVKILEDNGYDKPVAGAPGADCFAGLEGVVVQVVNPELTVPELSGIPIYQVELEGSALDLLESNPWPFYGNELDLV